MKNSKRSSRHPAAQAFLGFLPLGTAAGIGGVLWVVFGEDPHAHASLIGIAITALAALANPALLCSLQTLASRGRLRAIRALEMAEIKAIPSAIAGLGWFAFMGALLSPSLPHALLAAMLLAGALTLQLSLRPRRRN